MEHFHAYQRDVIPETVETMYFGRCYKWESFSSHANSPNEAFNDVPA